MTTKSYDNQSGLYTSRYYATRNADSSDVIVKVYGGYTIMSASNYNVWRKQK